MCNRVVCIRFCVWVQTLRPAVPQSKEFLQMSVNEIRQPGKRATMDHTGLWDPLNVTCDSLRVVFRSARNAEAGNRRSRGRVRVTYLWDLLTGGISAKPWQEPCKLLADGVPSALLGDRVMAFLPAQQNCYNLRAYTVVWALNSMHCAVCHSRGLLYFCKRSLQSVTIFRYHGFSEL